MPDLLIHLTKLSDAEHRFAWRTPDGAGEALTLVTRSFLIHDLLHFAIEREANLKDSFYGRLARAGDYRRLTEATADDPGEVGLTEMTVAAFTAVAKDQSSPEGAVRALTQWMQALDRELPPWLDDAFAHAVADRFRRLMGEWKAVRYGETMELKFPL